MKDPEQLVFTNHAIDRLIQRFPEFAGEEILAALVSRSKPVTAAKLNAEAVHTGRPFRYGPEVEYRRDDETGMLLICRKVDGKKLVVTIARCRRPKKH